MSLNIKNEGTQRRAQELARLAGETMTLAVDRAIEERLQRIRRGRNRGARAERLLKIGRECAKLPVPYRRSTATASLTPWPSPLAFPCFLRDAIFRRQTSSPRFETYPPALKYL